MCIYVHVSAKVLGSYTVSRTNPAGLSGPRVGCWEAAKTIGKPDVFRYLHEAPWLRLVTISLENIIKQSKISLRAKGDRLRLNAGHDPG